MWCKQALSFLWDIEHFLQPGKLTVCLCLYIITYAQLQVFSSCSSECSIVKTRANYYGCIKNFCVHARNSSTYPKWVCAHTPCSCGYTTIVMPFLSNFVRNTMGWFSHLMSQLSCSRPTVSRAGISENPFLSIDVTCYQN